ncbi:dihydropyrimidinase [Tanacetum coccineum]
MVSLNDSSFSGLLLLMILHEETENGWRLVIYDGKVEYIWNYSSVISSIITSSISIPHHHQLGKNVGNGKNINEKKVDEWEVFTPAASDDHKRSRIRTLRVIAPLEWLKLDNELFCVQPEKALIQAATPATKNARRRPEAESTLEAKRKKDLEWEVPRHTLLKLRTDSICLEKEEQITLLSSSKQGTKAKVLKFYLLQLEDEVAARAIRLAAFMNTPLYVVHVMSSDAMEEIARA